MSGQYFKGKFPLASHLFLILKGGHTVSTFREEFEVDLNALITDLRQEVYSLFNCFRCE